MSTSRFYLVILSAEVLQALHCPILGNARRNFSVAPGYSGWILYHFEGRTRICDVVVLVDRPTESSALHCEANLHCGGARRRGTRIHQQLNGYHGRGQYRRGAPAFQREVGRAPPRIPRRSQCGGQLDMSSSMRREFL